MSVEMVTIFVFIAVAFLLQTILGFKQLKNFSKTYHELNQRGKVLVGKNPKKFRAGTLLLLEIDDDANIYQARIMKGVTIFARFKEFPPLENKSLPFIATSYEDLSKFDRLERECILNAYRNYVNYKNGKLSESDFDTSRQSFFALPVFSMIGNNMKIGAARLKNRLKKS